ncbi:MAG: hypothetical protein JXA01_05350 [Dehalococcoidia bacterium]|nr:hypothetical protein [Dehalococcoidia bacterium]
MPSYTAWSKLSKMVKKQEKKTVKRGFYGPALDETAGLTLEEAGGVDGLDQEIAVLRLQLRDIIRKEPDMYELHLKTANTIANLVKIRYSISKEQKKCLKEAITRVFTELAIPLGVKAFIK